MNIYKTLTSGRPQRRELEGGLAKKQYDKKWQNIIKNDEKGGDLAAPEHVSKITFTRRLLR